MPDQTIRERHEQGLVKLAFFLQPLAFGSWLPRIPDIQQALGMGPAALAIALLGLPVGTLLTLPFAGPLVGRIGARNTIISGFVIYGITVSLPALATSQLMLFVALMLAGSAISFFELGLNVMADQVEKASGKLLMTTAHGFWSLGIMTGSLIGAGLAGLGLTAGVSIALVAAVSVPVGIGFGLLLPQHAEEAARTDAATARGAWSLPSKALLGICFFVFGITMTEGAMADWSAVFLREAFSAGASAGIGYTVFALFVALGRFSGDGMRARIGSVALARICGGMALGGILVLYFAPVLEVALFGFAIIGLGASAGFPLAVTAAASLTDRAASANVAVLSFVALCGFLVGPPMIGFVAEVFGLRLGLLSLLPVLVASLLLAGRLAPRAVPESRPLPAT